MSYSFNPNLILFTVVSPTTQEFCSFSRGIAGQVRREHIYFRGFSLQAASGWQRMKPRDSSLTLSPCSITHLYGVLRRRQQSPLRAIVTCGSSDKRPGLQRDAFRFRRQKGEAGGNLAHFLERLSRSRAMRGQAGRQLQVLPSLFFASVSPPAKSAPRSWGVGRCIPLP